MKFKSPFKENKKSIVFQTVLQNFPENYINYNYCEPFCIGSNIFLNKTQSKEEVISDIDCKSINILRAIRDEPKDFFNRLKKIKNHEKAFKQASLENEFDDYIEEAINEFILTKLSKSNKKKIFHLSEDHWQKSIDECEKTTTRLKDILIVCEPPEKIIETWNSEESLIFINAPSEDSKYINLNDHIKILELVNKSNAKIIISGYFSTLYNRMLKGWKTIKNITGNEKTKGEIIWKNF